MASEKYAVSQGLILLSLKRAESSLRNAKGEGTVSKLSKVDIFPLNTLHLYSAIDNAMQMPDMSK